jgi:hypothetical protein
MVSINRVESDLETSARMAGHHCWVESRLFEILGSWVASTPAVGAKLMLDRHSRQHAWRAAQWWERLPVLADVDRSALVADSAVGGWSRPLAAMAGIDGVVGRLAAAYRVALPRVCTSYARHSCIASPVSDGSTLRTLRIVAPDATADWVEGESALQTALAGRAEVEEASQTVRRLEGLFCDL